MLIILLFLLGYAAIATEHFIGFNKAGVALVTGILIWVAIALGGRCTRSGFVKPRAERAPQRNLEHPVLLAWGHDYSGAH